MEEGDGEDLLAQFLASDVSDISNDGFDDIEHDGYDNGGIGAGSPSRSVDGTYQETEPALATELAPIDDDGDDDVQDLHTENGYDDKDANDELDGADLDDNDLDAYKDSEVEVDLPRRRGRPARRARANGFGLGHDTKRRRLSKSGITVSMTTTSTYGIDGICNFVVSLPRLSRKQQEYYWPWDDRALLEEGKALAKEGAHDILGGQYPRRTRRHNPAYYKEQDPESEDDGPKKRKRKADGDYDDAYGGGDQDDEDEYVLGIGGSELPSRGSTRIGTRANSAENGSANDSRRRLRHRRPTVFDDSDELALDSSANGFFSLVRSDVVDGKKRGRGRPARLSKDTNFQARRSARENKTTVYMADNLNDEDDIVYAVEAKPAGPRAAGVREIFQQLNTAEFKKFQAHHQRLCDICGLKDAAANKGALVPCQGCSNSYHKVCLGVRSQREPIATKVGEDSFVLQCRFCVGSSRNKDPRAPDQASCQDCRVQGSSCAAFSKKKTTKQEELLRVENNGVDPITDVDPKRISNAQNVLFRCRTCRRAWHFEHLPHPLETPDPAINGDLDLDLRSIRLDAYRTNWLCKQCLDYEHVKPDKIVAWRPVIRASYTPGMTIDKFDQDRLEYLIKWTAKSYRHCTWVPGAWVFGAVAATMRLAFVKRTFADFGDEVTGTNTANKELLLRWTTAEAIEDTWLTPEIILDAKISPRNDDEAAEYRQASQDEKFQMDLDRILQVTEILVKFEGLGYEDVVWDQPPGRANKDGTESHRWTAFLEAYHEYIIGLHFKPEKPATMTGRVNEFRAKNFKEDILVAQQPAGLRRGTLMEYQLEGLNWMLFNYRNERSIILADEMGLGKTVQVVALLSSLIQDSPKAWPFLIVVPNATCANWRREIKKWAPDLRVVAYYGGRVSQTTALQYELFPKDSKELKAHVVIMSYDSAKDSDTRLHFRAVKWAGLVVDEAQSLKNDENLLYKALSVLRIDFKLLLTGTPLQNDKRELFNLLQFVDSKYNAAELDLRFLGEVTAKNLPEMHNLIRPYFLRRTKAKVLHFLPTMSQVIVPVSMTILQRKVCKSIMEKRSDTLRALFATGKVKAADKGAFNNILMQLRKCLCHPFVYQRELEDRDLPADVVRRNFVEASSKLMLLEIMLPKLKERGHRALIFSQFLDQLTILEDFLAGIGLAHARLDGSQSSLEKQKRIDAFNAPNSELFAMLLSTRAGGVGINLATADTVIILDPDWNPHQDIQALSRAHRIGQTKKVMCFQLMTTDSPEAKILHNGRKKMALDHLLIETMDKKADNLDDSIEDVLKHAAAELYKDDDGSGTTYSPADVDKLLDRAMEEETKTEEGASDSAFAFARVYENDGLKETLEVDDVDEKAMKKNLGVWDQILKDRENAAKLEEAKKAEVLGRGNRHRKAADYTGKNLDLEIDAIDGTEAHSGDGDDDFDDDEESSSDEKDDDDDETESVRSPADTPGSVVNGNGLHGLQGKQGKGFSKRPTPRKSTPRKSTPRKSTPRKVTTQKATPRKATPRMATPRKSASRTPASRKSATPSRTSKKRKASVALSTASGSQSFRPRHSSQAQNPQGPGISSLDQQPHVPKRRKTKASQAESSQTESSQTESSQTEPSQTESSQTESSQTEPSLRVTLRVNPELLRSLSGNSDNLLPDPNPAFNLPFDRPDSQLPRTPTGEHSRSAHSSPRNGHSSNQLKANTQESDQL